VNSIEEYYEIPQLCTLLSNKGDYNEEEIEIGPSLFSDDQRFDRFQEMRFRNFKLRTDNMSDCHVFMSGSHTDNYVHLRKILQDRDTGDIYLVGHKFQRRRPLFSIDADGISLSSVQAGITVCDQLSDRLYPFPLNELNEKCFALPLNLLGPQREHQPWVYQRYLH